MGKIPEGQKKRTIYLNKDLDTKVRVLAAKLDTSVSTIVEESLEMYLKAKKYESN